MAELRWILLGFGLAMIAGIWLWGRRRSAVAADETAAMMRGSERYEPHFGGEDPEAGHGHHGHAGLADDELLGSSDEDDLPTIEFPARPADERRAHGANPPVVTIDDLPENAEDVVLVDGAVNDHDHYDHHHHGDDVDDAHDHGHGHDEDVSDEDPGEAVEEEAVVAPEPSYRAPPPVVPPPPPLRRQTLAPVVRMTDELPDNAPHDEPPTVTIEVPTLPPEAAVAERRRQRPPAPRQQRIVAIRLIAPAGRPIDGAMLKDAFVAERLTFGRYAIFHRLLEGDRPLYSIASLVEPGSFDPERMTSGQFPGISLFAVFPGPLPAPQAFDELLATARRLADALGCVLQDDSGSSLTGQRVLSLREDLVHFEHLVSLGRGGRPGG